MKRILMTLVALAISAPTFAAKWNPVTGNDLKTLYTDTVQTGHYKGNKFNVHNCADMRQSFFMNFGSNKTTERTLTFPNDDEVCMEDGRGNRCYNIFQHAKKPNKYKFKGTNISTSGKYNLTDDSPDLCN